MIKLTGKEKLVLYSLVRWPSLNDIELSKRIPVKRPTITAIRNKLKKEGFYSNVIAVNFEMLGCEILAIRYGGFNPLANYETRKRISSLHDFPGVFFKQNCDSQRLSMMASKNFTEVMKYYEESSISYGRKDLLSEEGIKHAFFPLKLAKIFRFFDYAPVLRKQFNIRIKEEPQVVEQYNKKEEVREFTENEKRVLYAIVKYPDLNDGEIAEKVSVTRQSVNKMRKGFEE